MSDKKSYSTELAIPFHNGRTVTHVYVIDKDGNQLDGNSLYITLDPTKCNSTPVESRSDVASALEAVNICEFLEGFED